MAQESTTSSLRLRAAKVAMVHREISSNDAAQALGREEIDQIDPFTHTPPFTLCQKFLVFLNALWLAPIRFLFMVVPSVTVGTIALLMTLIGDKYDYDNPTPLGKWGRFIHDRIAPLICRWFMFGFGFHWIHIRGSPVPSTEAPIFVVGPHSSMLDIFVMILFGGPIFVAKEGTRHTPFFGPIITRAIRPIYVSRDDADSRSKSADEIRRRASTKGKWPQVLIYPEGTTANRKVLLKYKLGAFTPKLPVQPVLIKYNNKLDTTSWGGDGVGLLGTLFYTMCQFHNSLEIEFLPVYYPSQAEKDNPRLYADNVQQLMARKLKIPAGDHSIEDLILMKHAQSLGLPFSKGMVVYYKTSKKTGLKVDEMKRLLTRFAGMDKDKDGLIEVGDLAAYFNVPVDACLQAIFDNCNKTPDGKVSFVGYLCGVIRESRQLLENQQFMQSMFDFFDHDCDGRVSMNDITRTLPIQALPSSPKLNQDSPIPSNMNLDDFKSLLSSHPEYVVLFYECQTAGISCPPEGTGLHGDDIGSPENTVQRTHSNSDQVQCPNGTVD